MKPVFDIDRETLDYNLNFAGSKYRSFLSNLRIKLDKNPDRLSKIINSSRKYLETYHSAKSLLEREFFGHENSNQILSQYVSSKVVSNSLEELINDNRQFVTYFNTDFEFGNVWKDNLPEYEKVKNVLINLEEATKDIESDSLPVINEFFSAYSNYMANYLLSFDSDYFENVKDIQWNIDGQIIDGIKIEDRRPIENIDIEKNEIFEDDKPKGTDFFTPLKPFLYDKNKVLPRNEIIGNENIIKEIEESVKMLFCYNTKEKINPFIVKKRFHNSILLDGMPGSGKTELSRYIMWYADELNNNTDSNLLITSLDISSSMYDGNIQKLRSQLNQISKGDKLYLIFQDELNQLVKNPEITERDSGKADILFEFQKFLEGDYINRGNYILLGTTNIATNLPRPVYDRFEVFNWKGVENVEDMANLIQFKLKEGIISGYVNINSDEYYELGKIAYEGGLSARESSNICTKSLKNAFRKEEGIYEVHKFKEDLEKQLDIIDKMHNEINYSMIASNMIDRINTKEDSREVSKLYKVV
ncbi:hypothetical protein C0585_04085 [Candidatus Woesearchaeota archaeon]|nr:MAG: hypothetical protein C0585_04085 [Candidatus Woesearchaeota archaeon]